jgi:hypothetical protein
MLAEQLQRFDRKRSSADHVADAVPAIHILGAVGQYGLERVLVRVNVR